MANKGPLDVVLDIPAVNEIIVFANQYKVEVAERSDHIRTVCKQMTDNQSLQGGDGEEIKALFNVIADGCSQIEQSVEVIVSVLNDRLGEMIKMNKGITTSAASDAAKSAASKMGVLKE